METPTSPPSSKQCKNCGYLAMQQTVFPTTTAYVPLQQPIYAEVVRWRREEGKRDLNTSFICFRQEEQFFVDKKAMLDGPQPKDWVVLLAKERICTSYKEYLLGFDPKEHLQMQAEETLREEARKNRADDERRAREWRKEDVREAAAREDQRDANQRSWHIKEAIGVVLAAGLFTIIGAWISRNSVTVSVPSQATPVPTAIPTPIPDTPTPEPSPVPEPHP